VEDPLPVHRLIDTNKYCIFDAVHEYQAFKYTQALRFINKTISITNAHSIQGFSDEITTWNKFDRYSDGTLFLTEATSTKRGWIGGVN
jgi:hypothetical protein